MNEKIESRLSAQEKLVLPKKTRKIKNLTVIENGFGKSWCWYDIKLKSICFRQFRQKFVRKVSVRDVHDAVSGQGLMNL